MQTYANGHAQLAEVLISREVIFTEDVEHIFGKRKWTSRTDEILAANASNNDTLPDEPKKLPAVPENEDATEEQQANDQQLPPEIPPLPQK